MHFAGHEYMKCIYYFLAAERIWSPPSSEPEKSIEAKESKDSVPRFMLALYILPFTLHPFEPLSMLSLGATLEFPSFAPGTDVGSRRMVATVREQSSQNLLYFIQEHRRVWPLCYLLCD